MELSDVLEDIITEGQANDGYGFGIVIGTHEFLSTLISRSVWSVVYVALKLTELNNQIYLMFPYFEIGLPNCLKFETSRIRIHVKWGGRNEYMKEQSN